MTLGDKIRVMKLGTWGNAWHFLDKAAALADEHEATIASGLQDPVAVHANMLRGTIAKPSWDQIKHLYPDEFKATIAAVYEAAAGIDPAIFDHPSVYMGGPSRQAMKTAEAVAKAIRARTPADARAALELRDAQMRAQGRIEAGAVFATTGAEERYVADTENACPACGGSGHKDDARAAMDLIKAEAHRAGMREAAAMLMPAAREADLRAERDAAQARERALLDSNEANRQARLDANAAHQRQVDSLRAEVDRLTRAVEAAAAKHREGGQ